MGSHYPDVKGIQASQGCLSTEKRKIYPARPVEPGTLWVFNRGEIFTPLNSKIVQLGHDSERATYFTGVER